MRHQSTNPAFEGDPISDSDCKDGKVYPADDHYDNSQQPSTNFESDYITNPTSDNVTRSEPTEDIKEKDPGYLATVNSDLYGE